MSGKNSNCVENENRIINSLLDAPYFNVNSGCNSAASPPKTKEERANIKNSKAIF
jgi:hypothetical protein